MFSFDPNRRILTIQKLDAPEMELDLLGYQRESYMQYVEKTIHDDMSFLLDEMRNKLGMSDLDMEVTVIPPDLSRHRNELKKLYPKHYRVTAKFKYEGRTIPSEKSGRAGIEILRIPYMDEDSILNVDGSRNVLLMQTSTSTGLSYAHDVPLYQCISRWRGIEEILPKDGLALDIPVTVIVNEASYSAAEFLAAELQEVIGASIVGAPTSGKGFAQTIFPLQNGGAVGLSTVRYFTGNGTTLIGTGVSLDVVETDGAKQLPAAIETLK